MDDSPQYLMIRSDELLLRDAEIDRLRAQLAEATRALLAGNDTVLANKKLQERVAELDGQNQGMFTAICNLKNALQAAEARIAELDSALLNHMDDWAEETIIALRKRIAHERVEGDRILAALEMANVRVAELEQNIRTAGFVLSSDYDKLVTRAERANARIAELEATILHWTGEMARLTQNSCDDQDRAERAEAKLVKCRESHELTASQLHSYIHALSDEMDLVKRAEAECKALRETVRKIRATDNITAVWHIADAALASFPAGREG